MVAPLERQRGRGLRVELTPLVRASCLPGRVCGAPASHATPDRAVPLRPGMLRGGEWEKSAALDRRLSEDELVALEEELRAAALSGGSVQLLGIDALPVIEHSPGVSSPVHAAGVLPFSAPGGAIGGVGVHQLMRFPISRFNGVHLPAGTRIAFGDLARWVKGMTETRMLTLTVDGTSKFHSWDAHAPVGKTAHDFFHVNQKGMFDVFRQSDHAPLTGTALFQAKHLRYLKLGGRVFLIAGAVIDGVQLGGSVVDSVKAGSARPVAAQAVRTASSWGLAWAGAKAGVAAGALAGVETGPGLVLTAIGGGIIGGAAGYFGGDWIADWIYEN